jgi:hypothetical protein
MKRKCIGEWGEDYFNRIYRFYKYHADVDTNPLEIKRLALAEFGPQAVN